MKALQLLQVRYKDCKDKGFTVTYPTNDLSEAIKELEDLQNRSCESETCSGCINYKTDIDGFKYCLLYENDFNFICSRGYWIEDKYSKEIK